MKKTVERLNIDISGLPSFKVRLCQMQMPAEMVNELNRLAEPIKSESELTDIFQVSVVNRKDNVKSSRQLVAFVLDPRYWTVGFRGWFSKKILRRD